MSFLVARPACETDRQNLFFHNPGFPVGYQLIVLVGNGSPEYNSMFRIVFFNAFNRRGQGIAIQNRRQEAELLVHVNRIDTGQLGAQHGRNEAG